MARTEVSSGVSPLYGMKRTSSSASRVLTDRALEFDPRHLREQIDIGARSHIRRAHVSRHHVERLNQYADILQNERICDRAVLP